MGAKEEDTIFYIELIQLVFVVLKLCNVITWSWWLVFLPGILSVVIFIVLFILMLIETKDW